MMRVFVDLWICGFVDLWICGFVDLWICGFVDLWICGFVCGSIGNGVNTHDGRMSWGGKAVVPVEC